MQSAPKTNTKGFTIIELLLVVVIIGILSGAVLSIVNVSGLRMKARDAQRKSDIAKIQAALELYYTDNRGYPAPADWVDTADTTSTFYGAINTNYIDSMPIDPSHANFISTPCSRDGGGTTAFDYRYNYRSNGSIYVLTALMENDGSDDENKCADLTNWATLNCGGAGDSYNGTPDYCYGVQNPF